MQHEWAAKSISRSYRANMDSVCEDATAAHGCGRDRILYRTIAPDRRFRRVGAFLVDATLDDFRAAETVCKLVITLARRTQDHAEDIEVSANDADEIVMAWFHLDKSEESIESEVGAVEGRGALRDELVMMARHGFGLLSTTGEARQLPELPGQPWLLNRIYIPRGEYLESVELLHRCLPTSARPKSAETREPLAP